MCFITLRDILGQTDELRPSTVTERCLSPCCDATVPQNREDTAQQATFQARNNSEFTTTKAGRNRCPGGNQSQHHERKQTDNWQGGLSLPASLKSYSISPDWRCTIARRCGNEKRDSRTLARANQKRRRSATAKASERARAGAGKSASRRRKKPEWGKWGRRR